ncbi:MAG: glucose-1-phosphate adenylyltransferase [Planctomycetales bacterium]|nr:glucose-1-phosphate adenylyltransferase [Planctomycetales bacterium]
MKDTLAVVLAGGKGSRLEPLTRDRAKPAVPFGGSYRIIDFTLSNCLNSDMRRIMLLTQYKAISLDRHINLGWRDYFNHELGEFVDIIPPQRIVGFEEKLPNPKTMPGDDEHCLASMGIYVFTARFLFEQLCRDANIPGSRRDFGRNIIPSTVNTHRVFAFPFRDENRKSDAYWRDVGTLDAYFEANMDLIGIDPLLNMYDDQWPIRTFQPNLPPPKFVFGSRGGDDGRMGRAVDSIVCQGTIVSGGHVDRCVVGPRCRINSFSKVEDSILFEGVEVGRHAKIRRAIIDKGVTIPPGVEIGYDLELDRRRGLTISEGGIVVLAKSDGIEHVLAAK